MADEEAAVLEAAEFEFEVGAAGFELVGSFAGPVDSGLKVSLVTEFVEDVVHGGELLLEFLGVEGCPGEVSFP